jgi:hypothetical protein
MFYFSLATLTTTGYGDIVPRADRETSWGDLHLVAELLQRRSPMTRGILDTVDEDGKVGSTGDHNSTLSAFCSYSAAPQRPSVVCRAWIPRGDKRKPCLWRELAALGP